MHYRFHLSHSRDLLYLTGCLPETINPELAIERKPIWQASNQPPCRLLVETVQVQADRHVLLVENIGDVRDKAGLEVLIIRCHIIKLL